MEVIVVRQRDQETLEEQDVRVFVSSDEAQAVCNKLNVEYEVIILEELICGDFEKIRKE